MAAGRYTSNSSTAALRQATSLHRLANRLTMFVLGRPASDVRQHHLEQTEVPCIPRPAPTQTVLPSGRPAKALGPPEPLPLLFWPSSTIPCCRYLRLPERFAGWIELVKRRFAIFVI